MKRESLYIQLWIFSLLLVFNGGVRASNSHSPSDPAHPESGWHDLRQGFRLMDYYYDKAVTAEVELFSQKYFDDWRERIGAYQAYLNTRVRGKGMPGEIALLPLIESELNGEARSSANAVGFWQFMPRTAKAYGLKVSEGNDGRKDLVLSTDAALKHLEQLHREMGDWILAIAAYNIGGYRLRTLVKKSKSSNFWELELPRETQRHVAKLLALSRVILSPERHGLILPALQPMKLSQNQLFRNQPLLDDLGCTGKAIDINPVSRIKALDIHKQRLSPPHWYTHPDGMVPINLPVAFSL